MSGRGGNNGGGGGVVGVQSIPAASRKMVQSLKEIVNCPETEIYAMLKECNMDPNDAVNRLLSQDPFHEVKSKRDKKKENKDTPESKSRGASSTSNRGGRSSTDRYVGRGGSNHFSSESSAMHGKPAYKKENGTNSNTSSSFSASGMAVNNMNRRPPALIESVTSANKISTISTVDGISSASQPPSGYQPAWLGVPGQVSMADIVKMGRPHGKTSSTSNPSHHSVNHLYGQGTSSTASHPDFHSSEDHASKDSAINPETGVASALHVSSDDEWPLIEEPPAASVHSVLKPPPDSELHPDASNLLFDRTNRRVKFQLNEVHEAEGVPIENLSANHVGSGSVSSRKILEDNAGGAALYDNDAYKNMGSYHPQSHTFEHQEVEDGVSVASVTTNLEQVNIQADLRAPPDEEGPSVIIPNHLQVQTADCSHLSFGSFRSGINDVFSEPFASRPLKTDMDEASTDADADADADASSIGHSDTRNSEYYGDESLRIATEGNPIHRPGANARSYDSPSASQPEVLKQENPEVLHGNHYAFPSSTPGYTFENAQEMNTAFSQSQTSSQMQNLGPFSSAMAYSNSLSSTLLPANVQPVRDSDLSYSPFPSQSMPAKYGNAVSSIGGSIISMSEALKNAGFSTQPTAQTLSGTNVATGPALPQHLAVHPYSQPTLPLGPFANMISYPFLPQSYTYMPSAFQQAFAGNSTYHQSLAAVLPQYKNSASVSSLPQSAAVPSGYGAFGSSNTIPGNFPMNQPGAPAGTTTGYEDVMNSLYKDSNNLISLQQNENSAMWLHGPGSRTMSAVPASTYYGLQGQSQQPGGYRQGQQPSQNYGNLGYPNFYPSQTGISLEHQQQNPRDGSLSGSQGQPKQSQQQLWQNGY